MAAVLRTGAVVGLALLVAGCGARTPPPCPQAAVIAGLERLQTYAPGGQGEPQALRHVASIELIGTECGYGGGEAVVELAVRVGAERGPAHAEPALVHYFVAVLTPEDRLLAKQVFTSEIALSATRPHAAFAELIRQRIPGASAEQGPRYRVLLGLQPEDDDVERLLRQRGR